MEIATPAGQIEGDEDPRWHRADHGPGLGSRQGDLMGPTRGHLLLVEDAGKNADPACDPAEG
jgi:hypothetical protein